jgi:hypothetical protein
MTELANRATGILIAILVFLIFGLEYNHTQSRLAQLDTRADRLEQAEIKGREALLNLHADMEKNERNQKAILSMLRKLEKEK